MTTVPNGFSMDELKQMLENAQEEPTPEPKSSDEVTQEEVEAIADRLLTEALKEVNDPLMHKAIMVNILNNFIRWHNAMGEKCIEGGQDPQAIACWYKDAGKFQAIANILFTISVGENDWYLNK